MYVHYKTSPTLDFDFQERWYQNYHQLHSITPQIQNYRNWMDAIGVDGDVHNRQICPWSGGRNETGDSWVIIIKGLNFFNDELTVDMKDEGEEEEEDCE
jgi:hypothetical protein